jgi:RNA polymerase sigma-70 factor (ECF subfamily)
LPNPRRFEDLVLPHLDAGYNLARWLTRDPDDAQDVVQDACVRALRYLGSLQGDDARAWFLRIVRNAFHDWCARNRPAAILHDENETVDGALDHAAVGPEQAALRSAEAAALMQEVASVPTPYREVLVLREIEELSYREIAAVVEIPIGTVMSRLARARALLQRSPLLQTIAGQPSRSAR